MPESIARGVCAPSLLAAHPTEVRFFRQNVLLIALIAAAAAMFTLYVCPYFRDRHHTGVCVIGYVVLALVLVYGRAVTFREKPKG